MDVRYRSAILGALAAALTMAGCKMTGSEQLQLSSIGIPESTADQDCLAWKTVLLLSLNSLIDQGMRRNYSEQRRSNPDHPNYRQFTKPMPAIDVTEVLSVKNTRTLMDLIIEKEGGKCHKELLMDSRCMFNHYRGYTTEAHFNSTLSYAYLGDVLDLSLSRGKMIDFNDFLRKYHSYNYNKDKDTAKGFNIRFYCRDTDSICARDVTYSLTSSLGICLLKKHQTLLKNLNIFDLTDYSYHPNSPSVSIDEDSLQKFIDRSNQLSQRS